MAWKKGPLPEGTFDFGGIVKVGEEPVRGFCFADFRGDHALVDGKRVEANEVLLYDNGLKCPADQRATFEKAALDVL